MKKSFSKKYMLENNGCYHEYRVVDLFFSNSNSCISIDDILEAEIPLKDKYWFVARKTELTLDEKRQIAIGVASIVLEIYEKKYPGDYRPRKAIEAAKEYLVGNISSNELLEARRAVADAAHAAHADAAHAAYAAAHAAAAVAHAADVAAHAAYAAYAADVAAYAADVAAYAADVADAAYTKSLEKYLTDFVNSH